jgi:hypothetical protein
MYTNSELNLEAGGQLKALPSTTDAMSTQHTSKEDDEATHFHNLAQAAITGDPKHSYGYLSFNVLHKLVLLNHQHKLSLHVRDIVRDKTANEEQIAQIDKDLHSYRTLHSTCS